MKIMARYRNYDFIWDDYDDDVVVVYVDGSCLNNGRRNAAAGVGVWFNYYHALNISAPAVGWPTNNGAEIQAATRAIYAAGNYGLYGLKIKTDSKFLYESVGWLSLWRQRNFTRSDGEPLRNEQDIRSLNRAIRAYRGQMDIYFEHVPGHNGEEGNEEADRLAKMAAYRARENMFGY